MHELFHERFQPQWYISDHVQNDNELDPQSIDSLPVRAKNPTYSEMLMLSR
jgi:hypothetical protein